MTRTKIADLIVERLTEAKSEAAAQFQASSTAIGHFVVDELLPEALALQIHEAFPDNRDMTLKKSIREYKHIARRRNG
ncbi:hypothetical protein [Gilvibacter sp.]|uniref:hypothetical protein n=1 Tax=Gilvibacter sp. TaxID=2729997 RepID=UPI0035BE240A